MKEIKMNWSEFVFLIIAAVMAVYHIIADIIRFISVQTLLMDFDPGTAAYNEKAAGLVFPIIDGVVCVLALVVLLIVLLVRLFHKGGSKSKAPGTWIRFTNADAPKGGEGIKFSNEDISGPPIEICPECGARIYNIDLDSDKKEKEDKLNKAEEDKKDE